MKKVLIVVDMVNGFINEGALADKKINKITPVIVSLVQKAINKNVPIIAFKDTHVVDDIEFEIYPPHCIEGTTECELVPELKPYENNMLSIKKSTTNGYDTKEFRSLAIKNNFEEIVIVGCCTDICVEALATSLISLNKKTGRKTKITVIENAVYTFDSPNHNALENHKNALDRMRAIGVNVQSIKTNQNLHSKE